MQHVVRASRYRHQWWVLMGFVGAVVVVAGVGALGVQGISAEYDSLQQPSWAPPSWLFGPVWTILYGLIAVAGWLAWRRVGFKHRALLVYGAQLLLNALWTPLFFGASLYSLAFVDIALLWLLIIVNVLLFWKIHRIAAWLLVPYLLWVSYASILNLAIWVMN